MVECKVCIFDMDGLMIYSERVAEEPYIRTGAQVGLEMSLFLIVNLVNGMDGKLK